MFKKQGLARIATAPGHRQQDYLNGLVLPKVDLERLRINW
jgi:hypothetical protein